MTAEDVRRIAYQQPFQAFRIRLVSGEVIEITRTLRTTVAEELVLLGVGEDPITGVAQRLRIVPLSQIESIDVATPA
jgi:hypothetical protein